MTAIGVFEATCVDVCSVFSVEARSRWLYDLIAQTLNGFLRKRAVEHGTSQKAKIGEVLGRLSTAYSFVMHFFLPDQSRPSIYSNF